MKAQRFSIEVLFVVVMMILLKDVIFPFFISLWFPTDELSSQMLQVMMIMVGIMTCFIYMGLGSSAKYTYHYSARNATLLLILLHLPLFLPFAWFQEIRTLWEGLLSDEIALFAPNLHLSSIYLIVAYLCLFWLGRAVRVREAEETLPRKVTGSVS